MWFEYVSSKQSFASVGCIELKVESVLLQLVFLCEFLYWCCSHHADTFHFLLPVFAQLWVKSIKSTHLLSNKTRPYFHSHHCDAHNFHTWKMNDKAFPFALMVTPWNSSNPRGFIDNFSTGTRGALCTQENWGAGWISLASKWCRRWWENQRCRGIVEDIF